MIDFALTNTGDFALGKQSMHPCLRIDWKCSDYPVLKIEFEQAKEHRDQPLASALMIQFDAASGDSSDKIGKGTLHDRDELRQRIIIMLRTELGESPLSEGLGTDLVLQKHRDINDMAVLEAIQSTVKNAVSEVLEDPVVQVKVEKSSGNFYCQNVNVYIYEKGELLYSFEEVLP